MLIYMDTFTRGYTRHFCPECRAPRPPLLRCPRTAQPTLSIATTMNVQNIDLEVRLIRSQVAFISDDYMAVPLFNEFEQF